MKIVSGTMKKKFIILIVDDNMSFADRMVEILDDLDNVGYISVAANYEEAHRLFLEQSPDLVLLDINLPGKNGIELLKFFKKTNWEGEVIMITNHTNDYYRQQCKELGAKHFLDKSNDFSLVPSIIKEEIYD